MPAGNGPRDLAYVDISPRIQSNARVHPKVVHAGFRRLKYPFKPATYSRSGDCSKKRDNSFSARCVRVDKGSKRAGCLWRMVSSLSSCAWVLPARFISSLTKSGAYGEVLDLMENGLMMHYPSESKTRHDRNVFIIDFF